MVKCADCEEHEATIRFSENAVSFTHGAMIDICRCCYVKRIGEAVIQVQENYKVEKAKLEREGCR